MRLRVTVALSQAWRGSTYGALLVILLTATATPAAFPSNDPETIIAEATYIMGDGETANFAEAMVLQRAKQSALEEAGTYIESYTSSVGQDLTRDEVQTIAGGVLQVEVLDRKRTLVSDGLRLYLKIRAVIATDNIQELAERIR